MVSVRPALHGNKPLLISPGDTSTGKFGIFLGWARTKVYFGLHLAFPWVNSHLEGVQHGVVPPMLMLLAVNDLLIDQIPDRLGPAILLCSFTKF